MSLFIIIVPVCILTMIMSSRAIQMAENQVSSDLQEALNLNMNQLDNYLQNLGRRLYTVSRENEDYATLMMEEQQADAGDTQIEMMHAYLRLGGVLSEILSEYTWADNVIAYFPDSDYFVSGQSNQTQQAEELFVAQIEKMEESPGTSWTVSTENPDMLTGIFNHRNTWYGASFQLQNLLDQIRLDSSSNIVAFARNSQGILSERKELQEIDVFSEEKNVTVEGERYIVLTSASQHSDLVLVDLISRSQLDRTLPGYMRILFIISIIFLICIPLLFMALARWLVRPVNILIDAIRFVDNGNLDYRNRQRLPAGF